MHVLYITVIYHNIPLCVLSGLRSKCIFKVTRRMVCTSVTTVAAAIRQQHWDQCIDEMAEGTQFFFPFISVACVSIFLHTLKLVILDEDKSLS